MEEYKDLNVPNNFKESYFQSDISFILNSSFDKKHKRKASY